MHENLGRKAMDKVTGFQGTVTGYVQYLTGCNQYLLTPKAKDGAHVDAQWYDEQRLEWDKGNPLRLDNGASPGPDKAAPKR